MSILGCVWLLVKNIFCCQNVKLSNLLTTNFLKFLAFISRLRSTFHTIFGLAILYTVLAVVKMDEEEGLECLMSLEGSWTGKKETKKQV